jgi:competence CoiA-like predicted nuclease
MKYAIINGQRAEATKGARGTCPACRSEMIARICKTKVDHWAHISKQNCDIWWENETIWHREWKDCFDAEWQEVIHKDKITGEIHIADVTTPHDWIIEIQHSPMDDEERKARNSFYKKITKKIAWVIDGTKRKTDIRQFNHLLTNGVSLKTKYPTYGINPDNKNRLLTEWHNNDSLVFFDFKQSIDFKKSNQNRQRIIWFVLPKLKPEDAYVPAFTNYLFLKAFPASLFIETHINGVFDQFFTREIYEHVLQYCKELFNKRSWYKSYRIPNPNLNWLLKTRWKK